MNKPTITILHSLPGRLRLHLSAPPHDIPRFTESILGHDGLNDVAFTDATRSLLIKYDPQHVTREEVLIRAATAFSLDWDQQPVVVWETPEDRAMANSAAYAGLISGAVLLTRWVGGRESPGWMEKLAAAATGASVVEHGWREIREEGSFDPEVMSLIYLITAAAQGDYLRGAIITWAMTFGRHLFGSTANGVEIRPVKDETKGGGELRYELLLHRGVSKQAPLFSIMQSFAGYFGGVHSAQPEGLLEQLRRVSLAHGEMVEGLNWMRQGIQMNFK